MPKILFFSGSYLLRHLSVICRKTFLYKLKKSDQYGSGAWAPADYSVPGGARF